MLRLVQQTQAERALDPRGACSWQAGVCEQGWLGKKAGSDWDKLGKGKKQNRTRSWVMQGYVLEL